MLMFWPILSLLMGMLTEAQERTFRALLDDSQLLAGPEHQQTPGPSGQQANAAARADPIPGRPGQGVPPVQDNYARPPAPKPGRPGLGKATPWVHGAKGTPGQQANAAARADPIPGRPGQGVPPAQGNYARPPTLKPGKPGMGKPEAQRARNCSCTQASGPGREEPRRQGPTQAPPPPARNAARVDAPGGRVGAPQQNRAPGRQRAPLEVIDSHLYLDRLALRVPQRGLDCIEAVTGRPPRIPVRVIGGVINYCDPERAPHAYESGEQKIPSRFVDRYGVKHGVEMACSFLGVPTTGIQTVLIPMTTTQN